MRLAYSGCGADAAMQTFRLTYHVWAGAQPQQCDLQSTRLIALIGPVDIGFIGLRRVPVSRCVGRKWQGARTPPSMSRNPPHKRRDGIAEAPARKYPYWPHIPPASHQRAVVGRRRRGPRKPCGVVLPLPSKFTPGKGPKSATHTKGRPPPLQREAEAVRPSRDCADVLQEVMPSSANSPVPACRCTSTQHPHSHAVPLCGRAGSVLAGLCCWQCAKTKRCKQRAAQNAPCPSCSVVQAPATMVIIIICALGP